MPGPTIDVTPTPPIPTITRVDFSTAPGPVVAGAAEQITLYSSNFADWGFTACPVNPSTLELTGDGCVDPNSKTTGSGTMTIGWNTIPRILGGMTLCIMPKSSFDKGTLAGLCLLPMAFLVDDPPVSVAMKLELVQTTISTDGKYSEDSTIRVTAVDANNEGKILPNWTGTVNIVEQSQTPIYTQNDGCLVYVQNNCVQGSTVTISAGGTTTFLARSLADAKTFGPGGAPPDPALIATDPNIYPVWGGKPLPVPQWIDPDDPNDKRATGKVYLWFRKWIQDLFRNAGQGDLSKVLSAISTYSLDPNQKVPGLTGFPDDLWGQSQYRAVFNALSYGLRTNVNGSSVCGYPRPSFLVNTLYHEARHAYQNSLTSTVDYPGNDEDKDFLVNVIPIAPIDIFVDSTAPRTVCESAGPILHLNWQFLGPNNKDPWDGTDIQLPPVIFRVGGVGWAHEMDAYAFAAAPPR